MSKKLKIEISIFLILVLLLAIYLPSLKNKLTNWDDWFYIYQNPSIQSLSLENIKKISTSFYMSSYQPVTILFYLCEYHFFKLNPLGYHAVSLCLHFFNCLLVFWFIFLISKKISTSLLTGILFAIHPLQVESVAWISETKGLLSAFFLLGAILAYIKYLQVNKIGRYYVVSLFLFILSMLAKATTVVFPLALFAIEYGWHRKYDKRMLIDKIPFCIAAFTVAVFTIFANQASPAVKEAVPFNFLNNIVMATYNITFYLSKIFLPIKLSALYSFPDRTDNFLHLQYLACPIVVITFMAVVIFSARYTRVIVFGSTLFLVMILPVLQFVPVGPAIVSNRYVYFALIGIFYVVSEGMVWLYHKKRRPHIMFKVTSIIAFFMIAVTLCCISVKETQKWKNSTVLWNEVLSDSPSALAYLNRGQAYEVEKGNVDQAILDYSRAIQMNPNEVVAYINRGHAFQDKGRLEEAISDYSYAIRIDSNAGIAYYLRSIAYLQKGMPDLVVGDLNELIQLNINLPQTYCARGVIHGYTNNLDQAIADFSKSIELDPSYAQAYANRAQAYFNKQQYDQSWTDITKAKSLGYKPDSEFIKRLEIILKEKR